MQTPSRAYRFRIRAEDKPPSETTPQLPWPVLAIGTAAVTAALGWSLSAGLAVIGWVSAPTATVSDALGVGTQVWLLANGMPARVGADTWTLMPLALTIASAVLLAHGAKMTARHRGRGWQTLIRVMVVTGLSYGAIVAGVAAANRPVLHAIGGWIGIAAVSMIISAAGAASVVDVIKITSLPRWAQSLPNAVIAGALTPALFGAIILTVSLIARQGRAAELAAALGVGPVSSIVLLVGELGYLPNLIIWSGAYVLGAGFSLGEGSVVAPTGVELGLLPGIPVFGAVPQGDTVPVFAIAWLLAPIATGIVAALPILWTRRRAAVAELVVVSGLAGLVSGLVWLAAAGLSRGDLGTERLVDLGPRMPELAVLGSGTIALSAAVFALAWSVLRSRQGSRQG